MEINKAIRTIFIMSYPAMSVYEFEFLKEEKEVLEYWKSSSIYLICQRPVLYLDDITLNDGVISMKVKQRGSDKEMIVELAIDEGHRYSRAGKNMFVDINFYDKVPTIKPPYKNAAGIKLLDEKGQFIVWLTPERLFYEHIKNGLELNIQGDLHDFITYNVHYIGQAQNQGIWERLTRHEKLSKVLAVEHPFIDGEFSPYELSLIFLRLDGVTGTNMLSINPKEYSQVDKMTENEISEFVPKTIDEIRANIINDFEAYFINFLEPKYNKTLFKNYPEIKNGLKSVGYTDIQHTPAVFAILKTEDGTYDIKITPVYASKKAT
jgi:hypothetical protein